MCLPVKADSSIGWVLFDMGNVLVEYRPHAMSLVADFYRVPVDAVAAALFENDMTQRISIGALNPDDFVTFMNTRFWGKATRADYVTWYRREIENVLPGIPELVKSLKGRVGLAVLSNTFFGHWDYFLTTPLAGEFDHMMASHEIGATKPTRESYERALATMGTDPGNVVFFDDKLENVEGARAVGIQAFTSVSVEDTRRGLATVGLAD